MGGEEVEAHRLSHEPVALVGAAEEGLLHRVIVAWVVVVVEAERIRLVEVVPRGSRMVVGEVEAVDY